MVKKKEIKHSNKRNQKGDKLKKDSTLSTYFSYCAMAIALVIGLLVAFTSVNEMNGILKAGIWDNDVTLSSPVGTDILPGGNINLEPEEGVEGADIIENSFIFSKVIPFAIDYAIKLAIGLAVGVLVFGGYQFLTAYGNPEKQEAAKRTVIYALIGLILALTAYGIIIMITSIRLS